MHARGRMEARAGARGSCGFGQRVFPFDRRDVSLFGAHSLVTIVMVLLSSSASFTALAFRAPARILAALADHS